VSIVPDSVKDQDHLEGPPPRPRRDRGAGGLLKRFAQALELPGDVVLNLPRVTIVGNALVTVENHRGLVRYDPSSITIGAGSFQIVVEGEGMVIGTVETETITIRGTIIRVGFEE
jgi:sporulation protein YqfC